MQEVKLFSAFWKSFFFFHVLFSFHLRPKVRFHTNFKNLLFQKDYFNLFPMAKWVYRQKNTCVNVVNLHWNISPQLQMLPFFKKIKLPGLSNKEKWLGQMELFAVQWLLQENSTPMCCSSARENTHCTNKEGWNLLNVRKSMNVHIHRQTVLLFIESLFRKMFKTFSIHR